MGAWWLGKGERKLESGGKRGGTERSRREGNQEMEGEGGKGGTPQPGGCQVGWRKGVRRWAEGRGGAHTVRLAWELQQEPWGRGCSLSYTK